jgi:hypothetical protein
VRAEQLNSAKGRLRNILHKELYSPIDRILMCHANSNRCERHPNVLYMYELALKGTGAWPLESKMTGNSINRMLDMFEGIKVPGEGPAAGKRCRACNFNFKPIVQKAVSVTKKYFDGLCLDCMDASRPKFGDDDKDYWRHDELDVEWDAGCRIRHEQATWWFSFMGRKEKQINWGKQRQGQGKSN